MRSLVRVTLALLLSLSFLVVASPGHSTRVLAQATPATQSNQANEEVVRQLFDQVLNQGNMDLIDDLFTPDFVLHPSSDPAQDVRGQDGVMGFVMGVRAAFPDIVYTIDDLISEGDSVVVRWTNRGTHQGDFLGITATGIPVSIGGGDVFHLEGAKLKEGWTFPDNLGLLVQLGVIPGGEQMGTAVPAQSPIPTGVNSAATPAPADENRAMMERFWEVYNANDMDAFQSFFADDFVNFTPAPGFDPTAAGFAQTMSFFRAGFPDQQAVVNEIVVDGDMVVSRVTLRG